MIKNWSNSETGRITVTGEPVTEQPEVRQGVVLDTDGLEMLVVWVRAQGDEPIHVAIYR